MKRLTGFSLLLVTFALGSLGAHALEPWDERAYWNDDDYGTFQSGNWDRDDYGYYDRDFDYEADVAENDEWWDDERYADDWSAYERADQEWWNRPFLGWQTSPGDIPESQ
ncbi:hypothetical protein [uncultured Thiohalocapsa sp.]|uniref:hypothetical protein n=1 Tax=uncultured Thiohalocapsa sp. TaxID=768990 RepID=UPI0025E73566|nr:hypothetical protein [uncultured Thiohalocapsa sp.]